MGKQGRGRKSKKKKKPNYHADLSEGSSSEDGDSNTSPLKKFHELTSNERKTRSRTNSNKTVTDSRRGGRKIDFTDKEACPKSSTMSAAVGGRGQSDNDCCYAPYGYSICRSTNKSVVICDGEECTEMLHPGCMAKYEVGLGIPAEYRLAGGDDYYCDECYPKPESNSDDSDGDSDRKLRAKPPAVSKGGKKKMSKEEGALSIDSSSDDDDKSGSSSDMRGKCNYEDCDGPDDESRYICMNCPKPLHFGCMDMFMMANSLELTLGRSNTHRGNGFCEDCVGEQCQAISSTKPSSRKRKRSPEQGLAEDAPEVDDAAFFRSFQASFEVESTTRTPSQRFDDVAKAFNSKIVIDGHNYKKDDKLKTLNKVVKVPLSTLFNSQDRSKEASECYNYLTRKLKNAQPTITDVANAAMKLAKYMHEQDCDNVDDCRFCEKGAVDTGRKRRRTADENVLIDFFKHCSDAVIDQDVKESQKQQRKKQKKSGGGTFGKSMFSIGGAKPGFKYRASMVSSDICVPLLLFICASVFASIMCLITCLTSIMCLSSIVCLASLRLTKKHALSVATIMCSSWLQRLNSKLIKIAWNRSFRKGRINITNYLLRLKRPNPKVGRVRRICHPADVHPILFKSTCVYASNLVIRGVLNAMVRLNEYKTQMGLLVP